MFFPKRLREGSGFFKKKEKKKSRLMAHNRPYKGKKKEKVNKWETGRRNTLIFRGIKFVYLYTVYIQSLNQLSLSQ